MGVAIHSNLASLDWLKRHRNLHTRGHKSNSRGGERLTMVILIKSQNEVVRQDPIRVDLRVVRERRNREGKPPLQYYSITLPNPLLLP